MNYNNWDLFLDRDGVINVRRVNAYLARWEDFEFLDRADQAIVKLSRVFKRIFVVTNQQGVSKGLTTEFEVDHLHFRLKKQIEQLGGQITKIYYCPEHEMYAPVCRKPQPGMVLQAAKEFPDVDFRRSFMIGDFYSDILMGQSVEMKTVFIKNERSKWKPGTPAPDYIFPSLFAFGHAVEQGTLS